jgi:PAS domain S-box-containing protein
VTRAAPRGIAARGTGRIVEAPGSDGIARLWCLTPLADAPESGVTVAVGLSRQALLRRADDDLRKSLAALLLLIAGSLFAAWAWGRRAVLAPLDAIVAAARRMSRGDLSARSGIESLGGDVGQLARAFDEMAASLEARESEATQATGAMREANQTLQAILTAAPLGVIALDMEGRIMLWTPAAERLFGWRADEVMGRPMPWVPEDKKAESAEFVRRATSGERLTGVSMRRQRKDGRPVELRTFTAPLRRPDGTIYGTVGVMEDVTERKQLEDQLHRSQKMQAVGRLAGGVAHDFNNLLTVIRGYAELALRRREVEGETRASLSEIRKAALRANSLIRQLLTFSRQPLGEPQVLDLNAVVAEMANMLRPLIGEDIRLAVELGEHAGCVQADSGQLAQIIANLVVNARDAMPRGGEIRVRTGRIEVVGTTARSLPQLAPGDYCVLSVSDTGVGMDPETLQHAFEPFFSTKAMWEGTGLGLSTVYAIVTQTGGDIRVESEPGRGTRFVIYLPRAGQAGGRAVPAAESSESVFAGTGTVLVVEDEEAVRGVVCETLLSAGYTVLQARNGREALELSERHGGPIDLLLTDVVMPEMGGAELARRLSGQRPGLRVLFMSGYAPSSFESSQIALENASFIAKPFALESLALRVREALYGDRVAAPEAEAA